MMGRLGRTKRLSILALIVIALFAGLFIARAEIRETWENMTRPALPEAVRFDETVRAHAPLVTTPAKEQPNGSPENPIVIPPEKTPTPTPITPEPVAPTPYTPPPTPSSLPTQVNLAIPFTSQAPLSKWDAIHEDACEEASIYMVKQYFEGVPEGQMDAKESDTELLRIVAREMEMFGYFESTTADQTGMLATDLYGLSYDVISNPTADDIKRLLAAGNPVLVPAAGKLLKNPYFTGAGPDYHMLVLRGYTADGKFISNDPGTRRGEAYLYDEATLMNAIHDWKVGEVESTTPVILVLHPAL